MESTEKQLDKIAWTFAKGLIITVIVLLLILSSVSFVFAAIGGLNIVQSSSTYVYDVTAPNLTFIDITDINGSILTRNSTYINVSLTERHNETFVFNWNGTNISTTGLIGLWHFNNNTWDYSGYSGNGVINGNVNCSTNIKGKFGGACEFNSGGGNGYLEVAESSIYDFGSNDFSVSYWVYRTANCSNGGSFKAAWGLNKWNTGGTPGTNEWLTGFCAGSTTDRMLFWVENGSTLYTVTDTEPMNLSKWYQITAVKNSTAIGIYINGVLKNSTVTGLIGINNTGRTLRFGNSALDSLHLNGSIDEARLYNRALGKAEILVSYNAEFGRHNNSNIYYINQTGLVNGMYTFYSWANDSGHNSNQTDTRTLFVYSIQPNISINSPINNSQDNVAPTNTIALDISTNEQSVCEYSSSSSFNFGSGTRFSTTNGTSHTTTFPVTVGNSYNLYYICQNLGGVSSSRYAHNFFVRSSTSGSGSGGGGGGGGSEGTQFTITDTPVDFAGSSFKNQTISQCNIQLSESLIELSINKKNQEITIGNFHNASIEPSFVLTKTNTSELAGDYVMVKKHFESIKSNDFGKLSVTSLNFSKDVEIDLQIDFNDECPNKNLTMKIINEKRVFYSYFNVNKNYLILGAVATIFALLFLLIFLVKGEK